MRRSKIISRVEAAKAWDRQVMKWFGLWCLPVAMALAWIGERGLAALGL